METAADSRVDLQQVVVLGVGGEQVGDADHGAAERPPVLNAAQVLLLAGAHPACGGGAASVRTATTGGSREEEEETPTYSDDVYDDVDVFPQVAAP